MFTPFIDCVHHTWLSKRYVVQRARRLTCVKLMICGETTMPGREVTEPLCKSLNDCATKQEPRQPALLVREGAVLDVGYLRPYFKPSA
jgi:hypothetical protein